MAGWIEADRQAGRCLSGTPLPDWVMTGPVADAGGPHQSHGSYNSGTGRFEPRRDLPVYRNHLSDVRLACEASRLTGHPIFENDHQRLWILSAPHPETVSVASFKTKMNTISIDVTKGHINAVSRAEADYEALVIWQEAEPFSAGADLQGMLPAVQKGGPGGHRAGRAPLAGCRAAPALCPGADRGSAAGAGIGRGVRAGWPCTARRALRHSRPTSV